MMIEIVVLLLAGQIVAEDVTLTDVTVIEARSPDPVVTLYVDPTKVDEEVTRAVAWAGAVERIPVRAGQSLVGVVEDACGWVTPGYLDLLVDRGIGGYTGEISRETVFDRDMTISLPACLSRPTDAPLFVVRPISVEGPVEPIKRFLKEPASFTSFAAELGGRFGADEAPSPTYLEVFQSLNLDLGSLRDTTGIREYMVPKPGFWTQIQFGEDATEVPEVTFERVAATLEAAGQPREETSASFQRAGDPDGIHLMSELTDEELVALGACQPGAKRDASLELDVPELLKVLSHGLRRAGNNASQVTVAVPDTGVQIREVGPFRRERIYPSEWSERAGSFRPFPRYPHHQHGTNVATLALGGVDFLEVFDGLEVDLRITPVRLQEEVSRSLRSGSEIIEFFDYPLRLDGLNNAIERTVLARGVVNLSLTQRSRMDDHLEQWLTQGSQVLFVAAAGNEHEDLQEACRYPACYGGRSGSGNHNVITVAALDADGTVAAFSNFSTEYVDLAAPGCDVPVLDYDTESGTFGYGRASGTSFAAPQVAFTAALLRVVWPGEKPRAIKRRILTSATMTTELWWEPDLEMDSEAESRTVRRKIADGRRLDPVKALSVYQDVVEVEMDGQRRLIRGKADPEKDRWESACSPGTVLVRKRTTEDGGGARAVKKIAFIPDREGRIRRLEYYTDDAGNLQKTSDEPCVASNLSFTVREDFTGKVYTFGLDQLRDVVFAEHPVR